MSAVTIPKQNRGPIWTLLVVSTGLFMVVLDNLVVNVALPSIHRDLGASVQSLEWIVNGYVLSFAVLLLTGAVLGDRLGRRRMFIAGIALFTAASAGAALAPTTGALIAFRAIQGVGGAVVMPLTLTLLAEAFPPERRGMALGVWSAISGIAVALGPLVGGAMIQAGNWHWIFWLNVPIGAVLIPVAARVLKESHGANRSLDPIGLGLVSTGLFGLVFGLIQAQSLSWGATEVLVSLVAGTALTTAFVVHELRTENPMLPMEFFARRSFAVTNVVSVAMYFGMFGSIFFLSQYMQNVLGNSPLHAGLKLLVWTGATMVVSPLAGVFSERFGSRLFMAAGLFLQAASLGWIAAIASMHLPFTSMLGPFVLGGSGMALVFAPSANAILSSVRTDQTGQASGAANAIRELGGVLGITVLSTVFTSHGGYRTPATFVAGLIPALWVGAAVLAAGGLVAVLVRFSTRPQPVLASERAAGAIPVPA